MNTQVNTKGQKIAEEIARLMSRAGFDITDNLEEAIASEVSDCFTVYDKDSGIDGENAELLVDAFKYAAENIDLEDF